MAKQGKEGKGKRCNAFKFITKTAYINEEFMQMTDGPCAFHKLQQTKDFRAMWSSS
eukprot:gene4248-8605_t